MWKFLIYFMRARGYIRKSSFILHATYNRNWVTARNVRTFASHGPDELILDLASLLYEEY